MVFLPRACSTSTIAPRPGGHDPQIEIDELIAAARAKDAQALAAASAKAGVDLSALEQLARIVRGSLRLTDVVATLLDAVGDPTGIGLREVNDRTRGFAWGKDYCLAVALEEHVVVSVGHATNLPMRVGDVWPELKPWFKDLPRNRSRAEVWAKSKPKSSVALSRVQSRAAPRRGAESEADLMAEVLARPADDGPRMVLADWLLERGDVRGELIALQCKRAGMARKDPAYKELETREREIEERFGERMAGDVARCASAYGFHRGLVSEVTMNAGAFRKHGARLFTSHPIETLQVLPLNTAALAKLAGAPALALVRRLLLRQHIGSNVTLTLGDLAGSPHFERLEALDLNHLEDEDAEDAFAKLRAPSLETIQIYGCGFNGPLILGLARNEGLPRLTRLSLNGGFQGRLDPAGEALEHLGHAPAFAKLKSVALDSLQNAEDDSLVRWLSGPNVASLEGINVSSGSSADRSAEALAANRAATSLRVLDISGSDWTARGIEAVLTAPHLRSLESVTWYAPSKDVDFERVASLLSALPEAHALKAFRIGKSTLDADVGQALGRRFQLD